MTCRKEGQAVGDALGDIERFAWTEEPQYREVEDVDAAVGWKAETRFSFFVAEIAALHILHLTLHVAIRDEK